ncbi:hypothetical protein [Staphylococcus felis]|uniref:hypothetical protein n=1 Tax=Staphylococcus felis TaxID=46127 RepID=UPI000E241A08|nr:hypothetical protein [Staphylococcus felis]REH74818.1 hypothetical protein DOS57_11095 [Staphylococcus felis]REI07297.1 hypothetical protein DOS66_11015 [Staphylococcus felis]
MNISEVKMIQYSKSEEVFNIKLLQSGTETSIGLKTKTFSIAMRKSAHISLVKMRNHTTLLVIYPSSVLFTFNDLSNKIIEKKINV